MKAGEWLRASYTKRWTIINTTRTQTVAEHSFNVVGVAMRLARNIDWNGIMHHSDHLKLVSWALGHDIVEVYTGDIPTPFKRALEQNGANVLAAEEQFLKEYGGMAREADGTVYGMIVKLADMLEAVWFLKDHGVGAHAERVLHGLYDNLYDMVDTFEKEFPELKVRYGVTLTMKEMSL
jgi:5'-deoxynucleotidase